MFEIITLVSHDLIQAINLHAIVGLHKEAGQYRTVGVNVGPYTAPPPDNVGSMMNQFVDDVNTHWQSSDPLLLATFALWRINNIHPFRNGNGRTARALCYFILCVKAGGLLDTDLIEMLQQQPHRKEYFDALSSADGGNILPLLGLVRRLLI